LGLTDEHSSSWNKKDPEKIEKDLMEIVPKEHWIEFAHLLILSGREYYPAKHKDFGTGPLRGLFV
jgi:endonuclease-3